MGKHIQEHLLEHKERAEYGKELFPRLAANVKNVNLFLRKITYILEIYHF